MLLEQPTTHWLVEMNWSVRFLPLAVPEPIVVPLFSPAVMDQSTELSASPGNSQTPNRKPVTGPYAVPLKVSLTT